MISVLVSFFLCVLCGQFISSLTMLRLISYLLAGLVLTGSVRAESVDERFLAGLRERHQFRLAEVYGMRRWAQRRFERS